ncbi:DUF2798 domain-containing protein [Parasulfitobacter algicola]
MSFIVSAVVTFRNIGAAEGFVAIWFSGWISS